MRLAGVYLVALGAVMVFWPELPYSVYESWKHQDDSGKPSGRYVKLMRVGGIFLMLSGILLLLTKLVL